MLHLLRRHPWAMQAHLDWSLAMVFAVPKEQLTTLLYPGMELDEYAGYGFIAAAFVKTSAQRATWMPSFMADDFYLAGWRIFVRVRLPDGRKVRGLRILRSDTDSRRLVKAGALLTRYHFRKVDVETVFHGEKLSFHSYNDQRELEVAFQADLSPTDSLPKGSPFPDIKTARRFAGPMPYTFSYEEETDSIVAVEGSRQHWSPKAVQVSPEKLAFFQRPPFSITGDLPQLANAFWVQGIDYLWKAGTVIPAHLSSLPAKNQPS